jgi:NAD(P)-dependent dehydrogenase (short-subunit alcohol dehydrogenase family)
MTTQDTQMQGKICLITGATNGIGKATAYDLARRGATIVIVARDRARGEVVQHELQTQCNNPSIDLLIADLASQASIRQLSEDFHQRYTQLHVLINNAGTVLLKRTETVDGLETTFAVNHLAPFLLTNLLLDVLKASAPARIVNVNSGAHLSGKVLLDDLQTTKGYKMMQVYSNSKLAQVLTSYELARQLQGTDVTINCLHPGFVGTNIGANNVGPIVGAVLKKIISLLGTSPENGARTSIYLATSPEVEHISGKYFVNSVPKPSAALSYNETLQKQMWDISAKLVHLNQDN